MDTEYADICHYGVLGMKWGRRKNPSKAFRKASAKADRLHKKSDRLNTKANKKEAQASALRNKADSIDRDYTIAKGKSAKAHRQADRNLLIKPSNKKIEKLDRATADLEETRSIANGKASEAENRAKKARHKANKAANKSSKWERSMAKTFANTKITEINIEDRQKGKAYLDMLIGYRR